MDARMRAMQKAKLLAKRKRQGRAVQEERYSRDTGEKGLTADFS